ncbi:hypothetical protein K456DRAFT_264043 [Colletotrichum gloeosporioides 23]|nr:hypothetical protein K456DRAFT_264043 [Colletotrichum gloeosporioides 23]
MELGSILSAIGGAFATVRAIAGLIRDRSDAKNDILKAGKELEALRSVLDPRQSTKSRNSPWMGVKKATNRCIEIISAIETLLENHKNKKTRWALDGKARLVELQKELESSKSTLSLHMNKALGDEVEAMRNDLNGMGKKLAILMDWQNVPKTSRECGKPNTAAEPVRNKSSSRHNSLKQPQRHTTATRDVKPRSSLAKEQPARGTMPNNVQPRQNPTERRTTRPTVPHNVQPRKNLTERRTIRPTMPNKIQPPQDTAKLSRPPHSTAKEKCPPLRGTKGVKGSASAPSKSSVEDYHPAIRNSRLEPNVGPAKRRSRNAKAPRKAASPLINKLPLHEKVPVPPFGRIPNPAKPKTSAKPTAPMRPMNAAKTISLPTRNISPSPTSSPKHEESSYSSARSASWRFARVAGNFCAPEQGTALHSYVGKCERPTSVKEKDWLSEGFSGEDEDTLHEGLYDDYISKTDTPFSNDATERQVDAEHNERQPREPEGSLCSGCRNGCYSVGLQMPHCDKWLCLKCISSKFTKATLEPFPWPKCCQNGNFLPPSWATLLDNKTKEEFNNVWCRRMVHCPLSECGFVDKFYVLRDEPMVRCRQCMHQIYLIWGDESYVSACHDDDTGPIEDVFEI